MYNYTNHVDLQRGDEHVDEGEDVGGGGDGDVGVDAGGGDSGSSWSPEDPVLSCSGDIEATNRFTLSR